jgi:hypothetical protein
VVWTQAVNGYQPSKNHKVTRNPRVVRVAVKLYSIIYAWLYWSSKYSDGCICDVQKWINRKNLFIWHLIIFFNFTNEQLKYCFGGGSNITSHRNACWSCQVHMSVVSKSVQVCQCLEKIPQITTRDKTSTMSILQSWFYATHKFKQKY